MKHRHFESAVVALCSYETVAILSRGRLPTITAVDRKLKGVLRPILISGLIAHFYANWPEGWFDAQGNFTPIWQLHGDDLSIE